ncbi:class II aldolase/adducin family protein [Fimbriimonas ginsengisoli]|uniref:Ribulose-5-phosphate 4-epimerase-related epimerase and aldolase n=1 Tax=Fimbriimonas ginsengisoli Gsoil 348 TaxID=661478 RepID=A0A068NXQ1_FIMGI|nr:class II aldolase/adducin family protein [Fimbriimonas ginsengisoli]AIE86419.1 Ribulose-5-phosphate 4-epimerase-related epimerase and aldolase [Fimbriimonas ginsengisoli Gsoil 348]
MDDLRLRAEMCDIGRRLWQRDLVGATEGNLSVRLSPQRILCTPSGLSKGHMRPGDLVVIDTKGNPIGAGEPSTEIRLHLRMYAKRPDCVAVIHAHPPTATAFAVAGEEIPDDLLPEAAYVLGSVATAPFGVPGTDEVPDRMEALMDDHKTFLMAHHGAVVMGKGLEDAYNRMEVLERVARILLMARLLGGAKPMPDRMFKHVMAVALNGKL